MLMVKIMIYVAVLSAAVVSSAASEETTMMMTSDDLDRWINDLLVKLHLQGPLIRLTGLIIAAVAVQMMIAGLKECLN